MNHPPLRDWAKETRSVYKKIAAEKKITQARILSHVFHILPNVFSPKYFSDTAYFAGLVPRIVQRGRLFEIGTGTGATAICAALNGAQVVATDINPSACRNARLNARRLRATIDVRQGSLFDPIKATERFDVIFWNHPWNYSAVPVKPILLRAGFDYHYADVFRFLRQAKKYLTPSGRVLLGSGGFARLDMIRDYGRKHGYAVRTLAKKEFPLETGGKKRVDFLILEFRPRSASDAQQKGNALARPRGRNY